MAWAPVALMAASAVIGTVGALQQASAQSKADKFNAAVATQNSQIATDQANAELSKQQQDTYRKLGSIKAGYGAAGVTNDGSPMDVLADSFTQSELDANTIIYNGKVKAAGYQNTAMLDIAAAKNAKKAGYINAAGQLLGGASKTYSAGSSAGMWG